MEMSKCLNQAIVHDKRCFMEWRHVWSLYHVLIERRFDTARFRQMGTR
jgi:hypothetical protein